jgi:TRAP-type C4-dicarboxylate transport system substrate-binding protein
MSFSEVFTALQQNTIQGQENPLALIKSAGLYEIQKYCSLTGHIKSWIYLVIGDKKFQSLPDDLQKVVLESAAEMQKFEHQLFLGQEEEDYHFLREKGMEFIEVDQQAFEQRAKEAVKMFLNDEQSKLLEQMQAIK